MNSIVVASLLLIGLMQAPANDPRIGQRVITRYGTVLKVGNAVVDDERRGADLAVSGKDRSSFRIYRVEHVNGEWLWLQSEKEGASGWVQGKQVIPFEQAIAYATSEIRASPSSSVYTMRGLIWQAKGELDIAIADYNEAIRLDLRNESVYGNRGIAWSDKKEYDRAIADYGEAIRLDPKYANAYNGRAWLWATCPDEKIRDGKRAVKSATRACELSDWKDASDLDTLAAANAEAGDFDQAVKRQEAAIKLTPAKDDLLKEFQERLALYKEKKPYREPVEASGTR